MSVSWMPLWERLSAPDTWLLATSATGPGLLIMVLVFNTAAALLLAIPARRLVARRLRSAPWVDYLALASLGVLIPVLGPVLLFGLVLTLRQIRGKPKRRQPVHMEGPAFAPEIGAVPSHFGAGGAVARLRHVALDARQGARALMAIEQRRNASSTALLRETLGHADESLRLLAHGLIDRRESDIARMIRRLDVALATSRADQSPLLHLELATLHQEMLYLHLVREDAARVHLKACTGHLAAARDRFRHGTRWLVLMARMEHLRGDAEAAASLYQQALASGGAPARVLPYVAEQAWARRDIKAVRRLFQTTPIFTELPVCGPVAARWRSPYVPD
ncbi:MAG: hypothetical protein R3303_02620 [Marinobacter sp.]|nr:hypothetical protein [Marinobacter sp.]